MTFFRGPGRDFSERDRALLALLRPHLHEAYLTAERRRHPAPQLTPPAVGAAAPGRRRDTNAQIAGGWVSLREPCASTWTTSIKGCTSPAVPPRSPGQMLDAAAPWTSPWLPAGYEQNFWNAA
jgi:hypothetical protein